MTTKVSLFALRSAELTLRAIAAELGCKVLTIQFDDNGDGHFWLYTNWERLSLPNDTLIAAYRAAKERVSDD